MVYSIAKKYYYKVKHSSVADREDLINVGIEGLIKAYDRFDDSYGVAFSTYAVPLIQGEIQRFLRDKLDSIRFTRQSKLDYNKIIAAGLIEESAETISSELDIPIKNVKKAIDYYKYKDTDSLNRTIYEDGGTEVLLADVVGVEPDLDSNLEIELFLNQFDERTQKIIKLRLQDLTQEEIAKTIGVSQVQISRTLSRIKNKGKEHFMLKAQ